MAQRYTVLALSSIISLLLLSAFSDPLPMGGEEAVFMPVFVDSPPADTTVDCVEDVPAPIDLTANDGMGGADFEVSPVDTPDASMIDPCTGGVVVRSWTAIVGLDSTTVSQNITISPDGTPPSISLMEVHDTVACELALPTAPNNPDRYDVWISSLRVAVSTNATDNCDGAISITDDGGTTFEEECATRFVTFRLTDQCGSLTEYMASYTTIDTIAPVLIGVPNDTTYNCSDPIPDPPMVTATDNCTPNLMPTLVTSSTQEMDGTCQEYEYNILRTWIVNDSCDNRTIATQLIQVIDDLPPDFEAPPDITISCTTDPLDLTVTGEVTNVMDNCSEDVEITFTDSVNPGICEDEMTILRFWLGTDVCGNAAVKRQVINVADLQAPTFNVPPDITVDCSQADDLMVTGVPTNVLDECDPDPDVDFTDDIFPGDCPNEFLIRRTWKVTDRCGQFAELTQEITVEDQQAPTFVQEPEDLLIFCAVETEAELVFADWLEQRAGGVATDNCTDAEDITWFAFNSGTTDEPSLELVACPTGPDQIVQRQDVDFIIQDECGLRDTVTASFTVLDQLPPTIEECPEDVVVETNPGMCTGDATLEPPLITDECSLSMANLMLTDNAVLTSQAMPGQEGEVAVDPVDFVLLVSAPLPINVNGVGTLTISLQTVDGESPDEFFWVFGEDGGLLGQTSPTDMQCGDGSTTFSLTAAQINAWATDGIIQIRLEPNIPAGQPERFAINANCPSPSIVQADLSFTINELRNIVFQYSVDNGSRVTVDPIAPVDLTLDQGDHLIRYYATDCAGNVDSCDFSVSVVDREAPEILCPMPISIAVDADSCQKTLTLPVPEGATDNCAVFTNYERTLPATIGDAYLEFFLDPNLNDYLPAGRTLAFDDVVANAYSDVEVVVDLQGDFNTNGAFVTILGDDGSTLLTTSVGVADCNTPGQVSVTIPQATFNTWAADGLVNLEIVPNDITVPPGVLGDGINPCDPMRVQMDGDVDSISYITATLSYDNLVTSYFATGESPLAPATLPFPEGEITHTFAVGQTEVFYHIEDLAGNSDTCSFTVDILDETPPTVLCQPTNLFINPSGLQVEVVNATDVDAGSFDNCGVIDSLWLTPNVFDCDQIGEVVNVILSAQDESGNIGTCETIVGIAPDGPQPTANSGLCGGDTLFLAANPPGPNPGVYTYQWFRGNDPLTPAGPEPDLVLPGIDADDEGPYRVVITGLTGCTAEGVVNVSIEELPLTPELEIASSVCSDDDILLETPVVPAGTGVQFFWYEGVAPNGTLLGTSTEPMFTVAGPHPIGTRNFYLEVEANSCLSPASSSESITIFERPIAVVTFADTLVCADEVITLGVNPQSNAEYSWTGPNNFSADVQFPDTDPLTASLAGYYYVEINRGFCVSAPDSVLVTVKPRPDQPDLGSNSPVCEGEDLILQTSFTGASSYLWQRQGDLPIATSIPSLTISDASSADQGIWELVVVLNGCESPPADPIGVVVNPRPEASASVDPAPACQGDDVTLNGFSTVAGSSFAWTGPNDYSRNIQNPVISNITLSRAGTYNLTVTTGSGCTDSTSVLVDVLDNVTITGISDNVLACIDEGFNMEITAATLPADDGTYTYQWSVPGGSSPIITTGPILERPSVTADDAGVYTLEVVTADGCSSGPSNLTVDLNFIPLQPSLPVTLSGETAFCAGETVTLVTNAVPGADVEYFWNTPAGVSLPSGGENMWEVTDLDAGDDGDYAVYVVREGCASDTSIARNITVNPIPTVTLTSNSPVCEGDQISLQSTFYPTGNYSWSGPSAFGDGINVHNPVINAAGLDRTGTYRVSVEVEGCLSDTITTDIIVQERPQIPSISHDDPICLDDPNAVLILSIDTLSSVPGATYTWSTNSGNDIVGGPAPDLQLELADFSLFVDGGTFPFFAQAEFDGCTSALSNPTLVQFDTIPLNTAFAGVDTTVCSGEFELMGATPTVGTGLWQLVDAVNAEGFAIANPDEATSVVSGLSTDGAPYLLSWTLTNGACQNYSADTVMLDVITAEVADAGPDILVCEDEIIILEATPPSLDCTGRWTQEPGQAGLFVEIVEPENPNTEIRNVASDNIYFFFWEVDCVCGISEDLVIVNVSDPTITAGPDIIVCDELNEVVLEGEEPTIGSTIRWYSPDPDLTFSDATSATPTVGNLQVGENICIMEVDEGFCGESSRDTTIVTYKLPPVLSDDLVAVGFGETVDALPFGNDMIPDGTSVEIVSGPFEGAATVTDPMVIEYTAPANFVGTDQIIYQAVSEGCATATATIDFVVGEGAACKVPSIFTPNGDDYNDNFVIPCLLDKDQYPNSQVTIFNRWGDEVYRSGSPYSGDWNGTFSGEDLPVDTYFYLVELGDGSDPLTGYVMIQR
ncbi:MAG: gliding motility-associated C-terminal domain-containing protein [Bacteroidota bacterium]